MMACIQDEARGIHTSCDIQEYQSYRLGAPDEQENLDTNQIKRRGECRRFFADKTWINGKRESSKVWDSEQLHRDLHAALGTTKWQLDEFQKTIENIFYTTQWWFFSIDEQIFMLIA